MTALHQIIAKIASWPTISLLFIAYLVFTQAFAWRQQKLGESNKTLDARFFYTPANVKDLMVNLQPAGRRLYGITQITLDLVFPFVYGLLLAVLITRLYGVDSARLLLLLPLLAVIADILENATTAYLAWTYQGAESSLSWFSAGCTFTKSSLIILSICAVIFGAVRGFGQTSTSM